jgi:hypothetical protein
MLHSVVYPTAWDRLGFVGIHASDQQKLHDVI